MNTLLEPSYKNAANSAYLSYMGSELCRSLLQDSETERGKVLEREGATMKRRPIAPAKPPMRFAGTRMRSEATISSGTSK